MSFAGTHKLKQSATRASSRPTTPAPSPGFAPPSVVARRPLAPTTAVQVRKTNSPATNRGGGNAPPSLGHTPCFRDMQRACAYFQGASEASEGSCAALREELRQTSHTVEALQTELTGLRQKQGVLREEAAAWRAEREALLAQRDRHAAQLNAEEQRSAALQRQLAEQHSLMLAQQGRMRAERASAEQAAVGVRELREEVRVLEHQLERAAAERALGQRHANLLEGLLGATAGAAAAPAAADAPAAALDWRELARRFEAPQ